MPQGLSERSLAQWAAFAQSAGPGGLQPADQLLHQFIIGVHRRGEELTAHALKTLVDELDVQPDLARDLVSFVTPALALLEAYDHARGVAAEDMQDDDMDGDDMDNDDMDNDDMEGQLVGESEVGPGILVL